MDIKFAIWRIPPRYSIEYIQRDKSVSNWKVNIEAGKQLVDAVIGDNELSPEKASEFLFREMSQLDEEETERYVKALMSDDYEAIKKMIIDQKVTKQFTLLSAAALNSVNVARLMLANETDINCMDIDGWTPLIVACTYNNTSIGLLLIEEGADINKSDNSGRTSPLYLSAINGNLKLVKAITGSEAFDSSRVTEEFISRVGKMGNEEIISVLSKFK